jgi:hypothetical protein
MSPAAAIPADQLARRAELMVWPVALWPAEDRRIWLRSRLGKGREDRDNPAAGWNERTAEKNEGIHPAKNADQPRLRADGLRVDFLARLCTA